MFDRPHRFICHDYLVCILWLLIHGHHDTSVACRVPNVVNLGVASGEQDLVNHGRNVVLDLVFPATTKWHLC